MALIIGTRLGPYEILSALGAGGMGEVYRATDTNLKRQIAIKVLPQAMADDPDRMARFQREAEVLAALNHPNIAHLYGLEKTDGALALVMELVEGPTLADRIARGAIPLDEALPIAKQIAEALEAAHEQGIIHRDLKPANIKVREDGTVKVLDFGLAKLADPPSGAPGSNPSVTASPTITTPAMMTGVGVILGTAAYMSPEQAKGRNADKRSDVWAFGCVLYEMLTGTRAFEGDDVSEVLASVLAREPKLDGLPSTVADSIRLLVKGCLQKDRKLRVADISTALFVLRDPMASAAPGSFVSTNRPEAKRHAWRWKGVAAGMAVLWLVSFPFAIVHWRETPAAGSVARFDISLPENTAFTSAQVPWLSVSPDGRYVTFIANGANGAHLWVRPLGSRTAQELPGTENATAPFWSPDSRWIAFVSAGKLKKIEVAGGASQTVAALPSVFGTAAPLGGTWSLDGTILLGNVQNGGTDAGIWRVSSSGGAPVTLTKHEPDVLHAYPHFLSDGHRFLFSKIGGTGPALLLGSLDSAETRQILPDYMQARTASGYLLFVRNRSLMAQSFDERSATLSGEAAVVTDEVTVNEVNGRVAFGASNTGVLVSSTGEVGMSQFMWMTRNGQPAGVVGVPALNVTMALDPSGQRVVYGRRDGSVQNLWITDLSRNVTSRLTFGMSRDSDGTWSPDSSRIIYASVRGSEKSLYEIPASGGVEHIALKTSLGQTRSMDAWSPDGRFILYHIDATRELIAMPLDGDRKPIPVFKPASGSSDEASFSPDGKWIAYNSNESGRAEVYVAPFPPTGAHWQVSSAGGVQPRWRRDGRELFFLAPDGTMMALDATLGSSIQLSTPQPLFRTALRPSATTDQYAVAPDGQKFLIMNPVADQKVAPMTVVLNWPSALKP